MELKVINEITDEIKNFRSIEEFNLFYQKHKDEVNSRTTQYLNRVYKIVTPEGVEYRITRKNCSKEGNKRVGGDVFLRKVVKTNELREIENEIMKTDLENLKEEISQSSSSLRSEINEQHDHFTEIIQELSQRLSVYISETNKKITELTYTVNHIANVVNQLS